MRSRPLGRTRTTCCAHYHADGVSPNTATLPAGWGDRLTPIQNANTNGATGWCIEVHDIAIAKYAAGREKDLRNTEFKPTDKPRDWVEATIGRHQRLHNNADRPRVAE